MAAGFSCINRGLYCMQLFTHSPPRTPFVHVRLPSSLPVLSLQASSVVYSLLPPASPFINACVPGQAGVLCSATAAGIMPWETDHPFLPSTSHTVSIPSQIGESDKGPSSHVHVYGAVASIHLSMISINGPKTHNRVTNTSSLSRSCTIRQV